MPAGSTTDVKRTGLDFERIHRIIVEAFRNDGILDSIEDEKLKEAGLQLGDRELIRDTVFIDSAGVIDDEEEDKYREAGLSQLATLLKSRPALPPLRITYWGAGPVVNVGRYVFQNPAQLDGGDPNNYFLAAGLAVVFGFGRGDREGSFLLHPFRADGELGLTVSWSTADDHVDFTNEVNRYLANVTDQAKVQLEREVRRTLGVNVNLNFDDVSLDNVRAERHATYIPIFLHWRRLLLPVDPITPHISSGNVYVDFGMGVMPAHITGEVFGKSFDNWDAKLMGRLAGELEAIKVTAGPVLISFGGGVGFTAGTQGGADAFLQLRVLERLRRMTIYPPLR